MKRKKWMLLLLFALSLSACRSAESERAELSSDSASAESAASESAGGSVGSEETESGVLSNGAKLITVGETQAAAETLSSKIEFQNVDETVYVTGSNINIRKSPGKGGALQGTAQKGQSFRRTGYSKEWSRILVDGKESYIASRYLSAKQSESSASAADTAGSAGQAAQSLSFDPSWPLAANSKIHSGSALLYKADASVSNGKTICVNAGHGTKGGSDVRTLCHPDGTAKVTGGSTSAGSTTATAVSYGTTLKDGTTEAKANLTAALLLRDKLLAAGFNVLMIREADDIQLDNIARTCLANQYANAHIAIHYDSTDSDKGAFFMSVPEVGTYRRMEPVASHWQEHNALGKAVIGGIRQAGGKIFGAGNMNMDLTQTSYSTIPSIDLEIGDRASDHSPAVQGKLMDGVVLGLKQYFGL